MPNKQHVIYKSISFFFLLSLAECMLMDMIIPGDMS